MEIRILIVSMAVVDCHHYHQLHLSHKIDRLQVYLFLIITQFTHGHIICTKGNRQNIRHEVFVNYHTARTAQAKASKQLTVSKSPRRTLYTAFSAVQGLHEWLLVKILVKCLRFWTKKTYYSGAYPGSCDSVG